MYFRFLSFTFFLFPCQLRPWLRSASVSKFELPEKGFCRFLLPFCHLLVACAAFVRIVTRMQIYGLPWPAKDENGVVRSVAGETDAGAFGTASRICSEEGREEESARNCKSPVEPT